jgi:hypothetical protein
VRRRLLALASAVGVILASMVGGGVYAAYTGSSSKAQTISSVSIALTLGATGASTNRLNIAVPAVSPVNQAFRTFDLSVAGGADVSAIKVTTSFSPSSLLNTDTSNGLQVSMSRCSVAWVEVGTSPNFTYTCSGTISNTLLTTPVAMTNTSLINMLLTAGSTNHMLVRLQILTSASAATIGLTSGITFTFNPTPRTAGSQ